MKLSALSIRYPRILAVLLLTVIVWGGVAAVRLPRQEDPALTWRLANVVTRLPAASPERVESLITDVLERHVEEVDEVEHIYSVSRAGVSLLQIELSDDVTVADPVWQKVRHKLAQAKVELPPGVWGPDLDDEIMGTFAQLIAATAWQKAQRPRVGQIAKEWGMLTPIEVIDILGQRGRGELFCDAAVRVGVLSNVDREAVLSKQKRMQKRSTSYFVQHNIISPDQVNTLDAQVRQHNWSVGASN